MEHCVSSSDSQVIRVSLEEDSEQEGVEGNGWGCLSPRDTPLLLHHVLNARTRARALGVLPKHHSQVEDGSEKCWTN
ncbi:hypothetical protein Pmani_024483 [Petrolisthes manimaculis]|uniref:Uncharacterized protein n=1 Tax=Petrolisthes manimaculis TaxID=1843537 RepID=A0AAE1U283_9EUCA|nr:hypothetical protein Pmani_024483 [Petrolisthes manimaculis]